VCEYEVQFHQRLEQERAQWNQYREAVERELGELRRRLAAGREEENLEDDMKKVGLSLLDVHTFMSASPHVDLKPSSIMTLNN